MNKIEMKQEKKKTPHELTIKTQQRRNGGGGGGREWGRDREREREEVGSDGNIGKIKTTVI